jgi:hypothetical protein
LFFFFAGKEGRIDTCRISSKNCKEKFFARKNENAKAKKKNKTRRLSVLK